MSFKIILTGVVFIIALIIQVCYDYFMNRRHVTVMDGSRDICLEKLFIRTFQYRVNNRRDRRKQMISFAYGNSSIHNTDITREMVENICDEIHGKSCV